MKARRFLTTLACSLALLFGTVATSANAAYFEGSGAPGTNHGCEVGDVYRDTVAGAVYFCKTPGVAGSATWVSESIDTTVADTNTQVVALSYYLLETISNLDGTLCARNDTAGTKGCASSSANTHQTAHMLPAPGALQSITCSIFQVSTNGGDAGDQLAIVVEVVDVAGGGEETETCGVTFDLSSVDSNTNLDATSSCSDETATTVTGEVGYRLLPTATDTGTPLDSVSGTCTVLIELP